MRIFYFFMTFFISLHLNAQWGFNYKYHKPFNKARGNAIAALPDGEYIGMGIANVDSITGEGIHFYKFDSLGNLNNYSYYEEANKLLAMNLHNDVIIRDGYAYCDFHSDQQSNIFKVDLKNLTYQFLYGISNPTDSDRNLSLNDLNVINENELVLGCSIIRENNRNDIDIVFIKDGEIKHNIYGEYEEIEVPRKLIIKPDGNIIVLGYIFPAYLPFNSSFYTYLYIFEINQEGDILWEYRTPKELNLLDPEDAVLTPEGELMIVSKKYKINEHGFVTIPVIAKLNKNYDEIEWITDLGYDIYGSSRINYSRILESHDKNGYVFAGEHIIPFGEEENIYYDVGVIGKIDESGNEIWKKYYTVVEQDKARHSINDMEYTLDGGFVCYGGVSFNPFIEGETAAIQAWILKVDKDGNIMPDTTSSVSTYDLTEEITVFPNPTTDMLYIEQGSVTGLSYKVFDLQGKLLNDFDAPFDNHNYMLSTRTYPSGQYILQAYKNGNPIGAFSFVKE